MTSLELLAQDPVAFDTKVAELYKQHAGIVARINGTEDDAHREAGDMWNYVGRARVWDLSLADALAKAPMARVARNALFLELGDVQAELNPMDALYRRAPWPRFHPTVTNGGGHIHSNTGCHTLYVSTDIRWRPDLSGKSVADAVAELGPVLCQVCFPEAKAEWKREPREVARERSAADKAAAKAARDAKNAAKNLADDEVFRTRHGRDRVTTVAACLALIRAAVEGAVAVEYWAADRARERWTGDDESFAHHRRYASESFVEHLADAEQAERVLLAREAAHAGHGATAEAIARIRAAKLKSARREWAQA